MKGDRRGAKCRYENLTVSIAQPPPAAHTASMARFLNLALLLCPAVAHPWSEGGPLSNRPDRFTTVSAHSEPCHDIPSPPAGRSTAASRRGGVKLLDAKYVNFSSDFDIRQTCGGFIVLRPSAGVVDFSRTLPETPGVSSNAAGDLIRAATGVSAAIYLAPGMRGSFTYYLIPHVSRGARVPCYVAPELRYPR